MDGSQQGPGTQYEVVVNDEAQCSIWPAGATPPAGWWRTGTRGPIEACLRHIDEVNGIGAPAEAHGVRPDVVALGASARPLRGRGARLRARDHAVAGLG